MQNDDCRTKKADGRAVQPPAHEPTAPETWLVLVHCKDEADQLKFLKQMNATNRQCRALSA
jgi:hypothetical protein